MQKHICWPAGAFLEGDAWGENAQYERRRVWPSERDRKQERRDSMQFNGDVEADADGSHPPLAWVWMWRGTYSNLFGYYIQDTIRRWGYVIWDAARLERNSAQHVMVRQWDEDWGDSDPRDSLL